MKLFVPPAYEFLLIGFVKLFGLTLFAFRLPNILAIFASIYLILKIYALIAGENFKTSHALLSVLLFVTNPMCITGSLLVHVDPAILVTLALLFIYSVCKFHDENTPTSIIIMGLCFFIAILLKYSTPFLLGLFLIAYFAIKRKKQLPAYFLGISVGTALFLFTWFVMSHFLKLDFLQTFLWSLKRISGSNFSIKGTLTQSIKNGVYLILWLTPYFLLSALFLSKKILQTLCKQNKTINLISTAIIMFLFYIAASTVNHGFPKYFTLLTPLLAITLISFLTANNESPLFSRKNCLLFCGLTLYFLIFGCDLIYLTRFQVKHLLIAKDSLTPIKTILLQQLFVLSIPLISYVTHQIVSKKGNPFNSERTLLFCILLTLSFNTSHHLRLTLSPYQTNYSYGEEKTLDVHNLLEKNTTDNDKILASKDVLFRLKRYSQYVNKETWIDEQSFLNSIQDLDIRFIVLSLATQSIRTFNLIEKSKNIKSVLHNNFSKQSLGTYTIYRKKE